MGTGPRTEKATRVGDRTARTACNHNNNKQIWFANLINKQGMLMNILCSYINCLHLF